MSAYQPDAQAMDRSIRRSRFRLVGAQSLRKRTEYTACLATTPVSQSELHSHQHGKGCRHAVDSEVFPAAFLQGRREEFQCE